MVDPDLVIRTAGEMRVSNFLLWQISYAELWVTETCWPDFRRHELIQALKDFAGPRPALRRTQGLTPAMLGWRLLVSAVLIPAFVVLCSTSIARWRVGARAAWRLRSRSRSARPGSWSELFRVRSFEPSFAADGACSRAPSSLSAWMPHLGNAAVNWPDRDGLDSAVGLCASRAVALGLERGSLSRAGRTDGDARRGDSDRLLRRRALVPDGRAPRWVAGVQAGYLCSDR